MAYLGSPPASQFFAPGTDTFSGTGSQTAFTLSRNVATVNDILVTVNNVEQQPSNYTVASNILTFSPAPSAGTNNIYVRYLSTNLQTIAPQQGSVTLASFSATGTPSASTFLRGDNAWANPVGAGSIGIAQLSATGSPSSTTFLAGNNTWATPASPSGSIRQVVSTTLTSVFSWTTKGAWVNMTGISASITPINASHKILVQIMLTSGDGGNNYNRGYRLTRNGSVLTGAQGDSGVASCIQASMMGISGPLASNDFTWTAPIIYLDSPATTSSVSYGVQGYAGASSVTTSYINRPYAPSGGSPSFNGISTITLMEISA